jgi:hypothetical protein
MKRAITPLRDGIASMLELVASQRPDLLPVYLDIVANSPARFAVLELASDLGVRADQDLNRTVLKIVADLDRLESRRAGWQHPQQIIATPNVGGLLYFCRARIQNVPGSARRRRLEILATKLQRVYDQERTRAWINDFIGATGKAAAENQG